MRQKVAKRIRNATKDLLGKECTPGDIRKAKREYVRKKSLQHPKLKTSKRQARLAAAK